MIYINLNGNVSSNSCGMFSHSFFSFIIFFFIDCSLILFLYIIVGLDYGECTHIDHN